MKQRMERAYHVTCHECTFEGVFEDHRTALDEWNEHERDDDHRVSILEIGRPSPRKPA